MQFLSRNQKTGFFNPNSKSPVVLYQIFMFSLLTISFLTAMRQEITRMHKGCSLNTVIIDNQVLRFYKDDIREAPTEVSTIYDQGVKLLRHFRVFMSTVSTWKVLVGIEKIFIYNNHRIKSSTSKCLSSTYLLSIPRLPLNPISPSPPKINLDFLPFVPNELIRFLLLLMYTCVHLLESTLTNIVSFFSSRSISITRSDIDFPSFHFIRR